MTTLVNRVNTAVTLTSSSTGIQNGSEVSLDFTAAGVQVGPQSTLFPSGSVQFYDSVNGGPAQPLGASQSLVGGAVQPSSVYSMRTTLPSGVNVVTANYSGDQNFAPATTAPVKIIVKH